MSEALGLIGNVLILAEGSVSLYNVLVEFEGEWLSPTKLRFTTDQGDIIGVNRT